MNHITLQTHIPVFCIQFELDTLKEFNSDPEKYAKFLENLENDIFLGEELSKTETMDFYPQLDFMLMKALQPESCSGQTEEFRDLVVEVLRSKNRVQLVVKKKTDWFLPVKEY